MRDFKSNLITKAEIEERFKILDKSTECYIDFQDTPLNRFGLEYKEFQNKFYKSRPAVMEFKALVNQYYDDSGKLLDNFSGMWEYMMACYILISRIMHTEDKEDFVKKIKQYNESSYYLFYFLRWFEEKLISKKMKINKDSWISTLRYFIVRHFMKGA